MMRYLPAVFGMITCVSFAHSQTLPEAAADFYQQGVVHWMAGESEAALRAFEAALRSAPNYYEACLALGDVHLQRADYAQARKAYERARKIRPEAAGACLGVGHVYWQAERNYPRALEEYQKALAREPEKAEAHYFAGHLLLFEEKFEEAVAHLERAIQLEASYAKPHESLAMLHTLHGRQAQAAQHWRELKRKGGMSNALVEFNHNLLLTVAQNGVLFTNGEDDTYPMWYLQTSEGVRRDVSVVNLGLLNFTWYVRMLREHEARLGVRYAEAQLRERVRERYWPKPDKAEVAGLQWILPPPAGAKYLRVQDVVLLDLLSWNNWQRPIYFAVTLAPENKLGLDDFLTMEGLAWRLHPQKNGALQIDSAWVNVRTRYSFTHVKELHVTNPEANIFSNYAPVFCMLADAYLQRREREACFATLALADSAGVLKDATTNHWAAKLAHGIGREELAQRFKAKAQQLR